MNDELKTDAFSFIIPHSAFIIYNLSTVFQQIPEQDRRLRSKQAKGVRVCSSRRAE